MTVDETRPRVTPNLAYGICLVLLGGTLILDRMQLVDARQILQFWPLALVLVGATLVIQSFQATIEPGGEAVISVFTIMGGHEIWVPPGWTVVSEVIPVLGSVEDKRLPSIDSTPPPGEAQPRLVLEGLVILGGLIIKN